MRKQSAKTVLVLALLAVPLLYLAVRIAKPVLGWLGFAVKTEVINHADFVISGVVVDEDGSPFGELKVSVDKARWKKMGFETEYESEYIDIRDHFELKVEDAKSVHLQFLKVGYEVQELDFTRGGAYRNLRVVMRTKTADAQPLAPSHSAAAGRRTEAQHATEGNGSSAPAATQPSPPSPWEQIFRRAESKSPDEL